VTELAIILAVYLAGLIVYAEVLSRRGLGDKSEGDVHVGCFAILWPVIVPIEFAVRAGAALGAAWLRLRRTWAAR